VICEHLLAHEAREPPNVREHKATDWAAFKVSGDRSVTGFETKSWCVTIDTAGQSLTLEAAPVRSAHPDLAVKAGAAPEHAPLGAAVRKSLNAVAALRGANLI
jgi:hypothetical protein